MQPARSSSPPSRPTPIRSRAAATGTSTTPTRSRTDTAAGLIDDYLVTGTEAGFKVAVDAWEGESLGESEEYEERTEALGDDLLASAYLEPAAAIEAGLASEGIDAADAKASQPLLSGPLSEPLAIGLQATTETATIELASMVEGHEDIATDPSLLAGLPAGSWLAVAVPELGATLERVLDQIENGGLPGSGSIGEIVRARTGIDLRADVTAWLGDAAAFVEGTSAPGFTAGVIAETDDPQGPRAVLARLQEFAERDSGLRSAAPPQGAEYGFSLGLPSLGGGAEAGVLGDRFVAVVGGSASQVLDPSAELGDDDRFQAAVESLGGDVPLGLYLLLPSFLEVAELGGSGADPDYQAARPYLEAFESLAAGSSLDAGLAVTRLTRFARGLTSAM